MAANKSTYSKQFTSEELKERLTPEQYNVTQNAGTERAFTGKYWDNFSKGLYNCIVCNEPLFKSEQKFDAGCGWPSFSDVLEQGKVGGFIQINLLRVLSLLGTYFDGIITNLKYLKVPALPLSPSCV